MTMNSVLYLSIRLEEIIRDGKVLHTSLKSKIGGCISSAVDDLQAQSAVLKMKHEGKNNDTNT